MRPESPEQWGWFVFFGGGAVGGWVILAAFVFEVIKGWRKSK